MHASRSPLASALLLLVSLIARVAAFHVESGTACSTVGAACTYISDDSTASGSKSTTVSGFCAPDLTCASNGAQCTSDDQCFNYCGGGSCGGVGAGCNTQDAYSLNQLTIACASGFKCSANGSTGQCQAATSTSTTAASTASAAASTAPVVNAVAASKTTNAESASQNDQVAAPVSNASARLRRQKKRMQEVVEHRQHHVRAAISRPRLH